MPHDDLLTVEPVVTGDTVRVRVEGALDLSNAGRLDQLAHAVSAPDAELRRLVLDLRRVTFCDGAGAKALLRVRLTAAERGIGCDVRTSTAVSRVTEAADVNALLADGPRPMNDRGQDEPMDRASVLVVEDDASVREAVCLVLDRAGFSVTTAVDGRDALAAANSSRFDLVVLDLMLPPPDGFEVCRTLRETSAVPILVLTARADTADVVRGLELGADDYVTKPFEPVELVARARAAVRRAVHGVVSTTTVGDLVVDERAFQAAQAGRELPLTAIEFRLLAELARHAGEVLTREVLLQRVWGYDYLGDSRIVDMAVKRLRDKLGDQPSAPRYISTVRGVGYRLEAV